MSAPEVPQIDLFVVPLARLGDDQLVAIGLKPGAAQFPSDPEANVKGSALVLQRLGLRLGVLLPVDPEEEPDRAWQAAIAGNLADTKLALASHSGPVVKVLALTCI